MQPIARATSLRSELDSAQAPWLLMLFPPGGKVDRLDSTVWLHSFNLAPANGAPENTDTGEMVRCQYPVSFDIRQVEAAQS